MKRVTAWFEKITNRMESNSSFKNIAHVVLGRGPQRGHVRRFLQASSFYLIFLPMCIVAMHMDILTAGSFLTLLAVLGLGLPALYAALRSGAVLPYSDKGLLLAQFGLSLILILVACSSNAWLHNATLPFLSLMLLLAMWRFDAARLKISWQASSLVFILVESVWLFKGPNDSVMYLLPLLGVTYWAMSWLARDVVGLSAKLSKQSRDLASIGGNFRSNNFIDAESNVLSRYQLSSVLARECKRQERSHVGFSVACITVRSREANGKIDAKLVAEFARLLKKSIRRADICIRFEHESFIVILPATGRVQALFALQRIHLLMSSRVWDGYSLPGEMLHFTASCAFHSSIESIDDTLARLLFAAGQLVQDGPFAMRAI